MNLDNAELIRLANLVPRKKEREADGLLRKWAEANNLVTLLSNPTALLLLKTDIDRMCILFVKWLEDVYTESDRLELRLIRDRINLVHKALDAKDGLEQKITSSIPKGR